VDAYSLHGALCVISRELGYNFNLYYTDIYHAKNACIALLLESWETIDYLQQYDVDGFNHIKMLRELRSCFTSTMKQATK